MTFIILYQFDAIAGSGDGTWTLYYETDASGNRGEITHVSQYYNVSSKLCKLTFSTNKLSGNRTSIGGFIGPINNISLASDTYSNNSYYSCYIDNGGTIQIAPGTGSAIVYFTLYSTEFTYGYSS